MRVERAGRSRVALRGKPVEVARRRKGLAPTDPIAPRATRPQPTASWGIGGGASSGAPVPDTVIPRRPQPLVERTPAVVGAARHVVIVGAGFGGLACAQALAGSGMRVTVVDRRNYHLFQPLLYQVATAALSPADIASPVRSILSGAPNIDVVMGDVRAVDRRSRQATRPAGRWRPHTFRHARSRHWLRL